MICEPMVFSKEKVNKALLLAEGSRVSKANSGFRVRRRARGQNAHCYALGFVGNRGLFGFWALPHLLKSR